MTDDLSVTVLASGNVGKLKELQLALSETGLELHPQSKYRVPEAEEDGLSFVENALKKARNAAAHTGLPALADDSGLVVPALGGAPGIHSARYAEGGDSANNEKLLQAMRHCHGQERRAWFVCVLVLVRDATDPCPLIAEGYWHGRIAETASGDGGFGYDPLFAIDGTERTAATLSAAEKQRLSHRGQAVDELRQRLGY